MDSIRMLSMHGAAIDITTAVSIHLSILYGMMLLYAYGAAPPARAAARVQLAIAIAIAGCASGSEALCHCMLEYYYIIL